MLALLDTLMRGAKARAENRVTDAYAVELLDQKVRDAEAGLSAAKRTLANLVLRLRREREGLSALNGRIADLEGRARKAIEGGRDDLAAEAAEAIAELEGERDARRETVERIDARTGRMRLSVEKAHRRIVALKQGAMTARSVDAERRAQGALNGALGSTDIEDAEALVERVLGRADPLEAAEVRDEIERDLNGASAAERLGEAGFGAPVRPRGEDVLARLRREVRETSAD